MPDPMPAPVPDNEQSQNSENDPLGGLDLDELGLAELQKLADLVYEKLQHELWLDRDRLGFKQG